MKPTGPTPEAIELFGLCIRETLAYACEQTLVLPTIWKGPNLRIIVQGWLCRFETEELSEDEDYTVRNTVVVSGAAAKQRPVGGQAEPGHPQQGARAPADPSAPRRATRVQRPRRVQLVGAPQTRKPRWACGHARPVTSPVPSHHTPRARREHRPTANGNWAFLTYGSFRILLLFGCRRPT